MRATATGDDLLLIILSNLAREQHRPIKAIVLVLIHQVLRESDQPRTDVCAVVHGSGSNFFLVGALRLKSTYSGTSCTAATKLPLGPLRKRVSVGYSVTA